MENQQTVESGLVSYKDQEEQIETFPVDSVPGYLVENPFPTQAPKEILSRWYQIGFTTYTQTSPAGFTDRVINPLFTIPAIQQALKTFKYLRFKSVEFKIQYSTVPTVYGYVIMTCLPRQLYPTTGEAAEVLASHTDAVILDFSMQQDVVISSPWLSPEQWIDMTKYYQAIGNVSNEIQSAFVLRIWNPDNPVNVLDSTATNSVKLLFFARFVEPEVSGHIDSVAATFEAQSKFFDYTHFRGTNPNDEFRKPIEDHMNRLNSTKTEAAPKSATSPSSDPDEPELKPNLYGSLVVSNPKYVLGSGNQTTGTRDWSVLDLMRLPTLVNRGILDNSTAPTFLVIADPGARYSRISYMSQMYRMWRGTFNYTLIIFSSPFVSARCNVVLTYPGDLLPLVLTVGNKVIQDVTIRGTTRVDFQVPYLYPTQWQPTRWQSTTTYSQAPTVNVFMVSPPEGNGDVEPTLPFLLYESAHTDFRFRSLVNPYPTRLPDSFTAQMKVMELHSDEKLFSGVASSLPFPDDSEMRISQLLTRWSWNYNDIPSFQAPTEATDTSSGGVFITLARIFGFYSGQIKHKFLVVPFDPTTNDPFNEVQVKMISYIGFITEPNGVPGKQKVEDGLVIVSQQITQVIEAVVPFLNTGEFLPCGRVDQFADFDFAGQRMVWLPQIFNDYSTISPSFDMVSGGSDFSFYYPIPPRPYSLWPSAGYQPSSPEQFKKSLNFTETISLTESSQESFEKV